MKLKDEKGITGLDISAAVVIVAIFVSILATLLYNINTTTNKIKRRAEALNYAINAIEEIKSYGINAKDIYTSSGYIDGTNYYQEVLFEDYNQTSLGAGATGDVVVKATVTISYGSGNNKEQIELSTILT